MFVAARAQCVCIKLVHLHETMCSGDIRVTNVPQFKCFF